MKKYSYNNLKTQRLVDGVWITFCTNGHEYKPQSVTDGRCSICARLRKRKFQVQSNIKGPISLKPDACELCDRMTDDLVIDHDHYTRTFRGWLCRKCNTSLLAEWDLKRDRFLAYLDRTRQ